jgi:hypothetical protein
MILLNGKICIHSLARKGLKLVTPTFDFHQRLSTSHKQSRGRCVDKGEMIL